MTAGCSKITTALGLVLMGLATVSARAADGSAPADKANCTTGGGDCSTAKYDPALAPRPKKANLLATLYACNRGDDCECQSCCPDPRPFAGLYASCFNDFLEVCDGCTWKAEASALFLHRPTPGSTTVLIDSNTGGTLFDTSRQEFPYAAGPRVSLTALDCEGWGFEVNFFQVDGWSVENDFANRVLPGGVANLVVDSVIQIPVTDARFEATSALYSLESNFRRPLFGSISGLAGFRWVRLTDRYLAQGTSAATANLVTESIETRNNLYGFQIGADGRLCQEQGRWRLNAFVKGGVFFNDANQATNFSDPGGLGVMAANTSRDQVAFFGETGLVGCFQITEHLAATAGYQVMFINGVAQPGNQMAVTDLAGGTVAVDADSGLFLHGANVGLELAW